MARLGITSLLGMALLMVISGSEMSEGLALMFGAGAFYLLMMAYLMFE